MCRGWDWPGIVVGLLSALFFARLWGWYGPSWRLLKYLFYLSLLQLVTLTDLRYRLVLNVVIYPALPIVLLTHLLSPHPGVLNALLGSAIGPIPFLLVVLLRRGAMGAGDVKLAALIGVMVGFPHVLWALMLGILAGGIGALLILVTGRGGLKSYIPYGPFLCLGAALALLNPSPFLLMR